MTTRTRKLDIVIVEDGHEFAAVSRSEPVFFLIAPTEEAAVARAQGAIVDYFQTFEGADIKSVKLEKIAEPEPIRVRSVGRFGAQLAYA